MKISVQKAITIAFFVSLVSAIAFTTILFLFGRNRTYALKEGELLKKVQSHTQVSPEKTSFNILLLGYGGAGHSGGGLADAQVLVHLDTVDKTATAIAVPRDTWVELPIRSDVKQYFKINAAFAIGNDDNGYGLKQPEFKGPDGGGQMAKYAMEDVTGLGVDYYAAVDFSRFENAIDTLGGITVNVPVSFADPHYPIKGEENNLCGKSLEEAEALKFQYTGFELEKQYECRYETLSFGAGPTEMNGATALKFIRSRHSPEHGGDFARGVRQQAVLMGIKNKLLSLGALNKIDEFYAEFSQMISTDMQEADVIEVLSHVGMPNDYTLATLNINGDNFMTGSRSSDGQSIVIPKAGIGNFSEIHEYLANELQ